MQEVIDMHGEVLIEIRGIYDGWSVRQLPSGEYINRWSQDDRRHKPTQEWIDRRKAAEEKPSEGAR